MRYKVSAYIQVLYAESTCEMLLHYQCVVADSGVGGVGGARLLRCQSSSRNRGKRDERMRGRRMLRKRARLESSCHVTKVSSLSVDSIGSRILGRV